MKPRFLFEGTPENSKYAIDRIFFQQIGISLVAGEISLALSSSVPSEADDALIGTDTDDVLDGLGGNDFLIGEDGNDSMYGRAGDDILDGGLGDDFMVGGSGNDVYFVDGEGDVIVEDGADDYDEVYSSVSYSLSENLETLYLIADGNVNGTGNALANTIYGSSGDNILDGRGGADIMYGGAGNDTYVVDDMDDIVEESEDHGADHVMSYISYTLNYNVENLTLLGDAAINGFGNERHNTLIGNSAANLLDGGLGVDTMVGGLGDDIYIVNSVGDVVLENSGEGIDEVVSSVTYTLGANLENLTLAGSSSINGTGNALNNFIVGNSAANTLTGGAGNDILDGGLGADRLVGGVGDDSYYVDMSSDVIVENASEGTDTVFSSFTYTLGSNLENLTLIGFNAINGTGNSLGNVLVGNDANNVLNGGAGADSMRGGAGNDSYVVDNTSDAIVELFDEGIDSVSSSVTYTLSANVENITLTGTSAINATGNSLDNVLTGNSGKNILNGGAGNDTLNGLAGADTMVGGLGDDTYVVDNASDVVSEAANEGVDSVNSSVTYTLASNVENLSLTGTSAISGTGNALDNTLIGNGAANVLTGNAGNDVLNGMGGADTMRGGVGNDIYFVDASGDIVTENANEGIDTVNSYITYTLGNNVENLSLIGSSAINGTGNSLANTLAGNTANNILSGGAGNDTYLFGRGGAADTVIDSDSASGNRDVLSFLHDIASDQLWFRRIGSGLEVSVIGTSDSVTVSNWYSGTANQIEQFKTSDGMTLLNSQVEGLVSAMAAFAPPPSGQMTLTQSYRDELAAVIASSWS